MILSITLTEVEEKALGFMAADPQEWFENFVRHRARMSMQEIYEMEVARMRADPNVTSIPVNVEDVVMAATLPATTTQPPIPLPPV